MTSTGGSPGAPGQAGSIAPPLFNPFDPEFRINPYPFYERIRAEAPIHQAAFGGWVFSRYAECEAILGDHRFSSDGRNSEAYHAFMAQRGPLTPEEQLLENARPFLFRDPPDHTRLRGLVNKAFTPRVVEALRPRIRQIVDELIDAVRDAGSMEVIEDLAYPLPITVICEMLGVPAEDRHLFREWSRELAHSLDPEPVLPADVIERRNQAVTAFRSYFTSLLDERRREPRDDLLSALIAAEEQGDVLTEQELLSTLTLLLVAGHETTVSLIGNGVLALLRHPEQLELLRNDPSLARSAVEEILRYDPPVQLDGRTALEDVEIGGVTVRRGQEAVLLLGSANRDPDQFPDPDRLDITRADNRHIAFGYGIHFCIGAPLARLEGQIALSTFVRRLRDLRLLTDEPEYKENIVLRGLRALPVGFSGSF